MRVEYRVYSYLNAYISYFFIEFLWEIRFCYRLEVGDMDV